MMHNAGFMTHDQLSSLGFAALGKRVLIHGSCVLVGCGRMRIGDDVRIDPFCVLTAGEPLEIGRRVHIASHCTLTGASGIAIGDFAGLSQGVRILSASDDYAAGALIGPTAPTDLRALHAGPVRIERHACIGAGGVALPGSVVEEGATVGALSLIKGRIAAWTVNAGIPAKVIGVRDREGVLRAEAELMRRER